MSGAQTQPQSYATVALRASSQNLQNDVRKSQVTASTGMATNGAAKKNNLTNKNIGESNNQDGTVSNNNALGIIG